MISHRGDEIFQGDDLQVFGTNHDNAAGGNESGLFLVGLAADFNHLEVTAELKVVVWRGCKHTA